MNSPSTIFEQAINAKALIIFAHGAGADKSGIFMQLMSSLLVEQQISVLRFNFNYMDKRLIDGKKYPPERMPKLLTCFEQVLKEHHSELPLFLLGKSMGGRVAATLMSDEGADYEVTSNILGVICLGYPFHPQKKLANLRLSPLQTPKLPTLILQGDRDALGNKTEISDYEVDKKVHVEFFEDGDHDLKPRVKSGFTHQQHIERASQQIIRFIDEQCKF